MRGNATPCWTRSRLTKGRGATAWRARDARSASVEFAGPPISDVELPRWRDRFDTVGDAVARDRIGERLSEYRCCLAGLRHFRYG